VGRSASVTVQKADEAAFKIVGSMLKKEFGLRPLETLVTRRAKEVPGIQLADFLLGAALADWQKKAVSLHKLRVRRYLAEHLGWPDMRSDTHPSVWKFNLWYFYDPKYWSPAGNTHTRSKFQVANTAF
jgi:hypothetical protein